VGEWLVFGSAHLVGVAEVDAQHRHLVRLVNALNHAIAAHRSSQEIHSMFQGLIDYTVMHFDTEQRLMQASGYPELALHLREHEALVHEVQRLSAQVDKGTDMLILQTIKDWLLAHIDSSDKAMGAYLVAQGHR
jgi:hemerythrin-like metal-binding protein